uniref:Uncharacterized protein n=1 Tax=Arundo donax TaxID=35708 RepID=A0A0A9GMA2_ARUDO
MINDFLGNLALWLLTKWSQWKSGWPVDVRQRCHILLLGFTCFGVVMTSVNGKVGVVCVANTRCDTTKPVIRSMDSILSEYSAQNSIRCICPTSPNHICWIDVFYISWNTDVLEMLLNLLLHVDTKVTKYHIS